MTDTTPTPPAAQPAPQPTPAPVAAPAAAPTATPAATSAPAAAPAPAPYKPLVFTAKPMKIGVVPCLNSQPLVWGMKDHHQLFPIPPGKLGQMLKDGQLDVAIAPVVASFLDPTLQIVPVAAIGSKGAIKSVRILSHGPLGNVERLFVDDRSQTSVLMARLILKRWFGVKKLEVKPVDMAAFHPNQAKPWEGTLQFGDMALIAPPTGMTVTDLGEEWFLRTQKPFIHAVWLARNVEIAREIKEDLMAAKNEGVKHYQEIVDQYKGIWVFERAKAKEYLEKYVVYEYGPEEVKGQLEFQKLLKEEGLIL